VAQAQREALGAAFGEETFAAVWTAGSGMGLEQALDELERECRA
jgi:hypothetical protein